MKHLKCHIYEERKNIGALHIFKTPHGIEWDQVKSIKFVECGGQAFECVCVYITSLSTHLLVDT